MNVYPTLVVWGVPYKVQSDRANPKWRYKRALGWVAVPKGWSSEASAKNVLDPVESLFLLPEGVEDVLIMGMSTGMISGGLFE